MILKTLSAVASKIKTKNLKSGAIVCVLWYKSELVNLSSSLLYQRAPIQKRTESLKDLAFFQALKQSLKESQINETHLKLFGQGADDRKTRGPDTKVQVETHLTLSAVAFKIKTKNLTSGTKANFSTCQALKEILKESQISETHMKLFGREPMAGDGGTLKQTKGADIFIKE